MRAACVRVVRHSWRQHLAQQPLPTLAACRNAGTDGRVFLQLLGERGSSPAAELQHSAAASAAASFQRGGVDAFTLQLPRLGALSGARLWLRDACGGAWRPELMVVTGPDGDVSYFSVSAWLGRPGEPGCEVVPLELRAQSSDPRQRLRDYKVCARVHRPRLLLLASAAPAWRACCAVLSLHRSTAGGHASNLVRAVCAERTPACFCLCCVACCTHAGGHAHERPARRRQ